MSIKLLFFLQIHKKAKPYIRFHLIIYSGQETKETRDKGDEWTRKQAATHTAPLPPGEGPGGGLSGALGFTHY